MSGHLEYPGICRLCGKRWGDHKTDYYIKHVNPNACRFEPFPGEPDRPVLRRKRSDNGAKA